MSYAEFIALFAFILGSARIKAAASQGEQKTLDKSYQY